METPTITLKGKTYTAPPPKVKLWREVTKFKDKFGDKEQGDEEALSEMERLIAAAFNHPEITAELIEEELDLDEFVPLFYQIAGWVAEAVSRKMAELPNQVPPAGPDLSRLSAYQMVVYFYLVLAQSYHWLPEQIDAMALDMFWDLLIVGSAVNEAENNRAGYIDDIW